MYCPEPAATGVAGWSAGAHASVANAMSANRLARRGVMVTLGAATSNRGTAQTMLRRLLERVRELQHAPVVTVPPDDLEPDGQSAARESSRDADGWIRHERHVPTAPHPVDVRLHRNACH